MEVPTHTPPPILCPEQASFETPGGLQQGPTQGGSREPFPPPPGGGSRTQKIRIKKTSPKRDQKETALRPDPALGVTDLSLGGMGDGRWRVEYRCWGIAHLDGQGPFVRSCLNRRLLRCLEIPFQIKDLVKSVPSMDPNGLLNEWGQFETRWSQRDPWPKRPHRLEGPYAIVAQAVPRWGVRVYST